MDKFKPLGINNYGSIGHLPGSNTGPADHTLNEGQARILTEKCRRGDTVIVREKLDGTNVGVAKVNGKLIAIQRSGYECKSSPYEQHHKFAEYVEINCLAFSKLLGEGERVAGEWLAQAHGTRYRLNGDAFFAFDIFTPDNKRQPDEWIEERLKCFGFQMPRLIHRGCSSCAIHCVLELLGPFGFHGAIDLCEGAVWRVEGEHGTDILGKYVRPEKMAGLFLPDLRDRQIVWNQQ